MNEIDELIARNKIGQLVQRYSVAVDGRDLDGISELFVDDVRNGKYGVGRDGVKTYYDHILRHARISIHFVGNHVVDFDDDDHARGIVYCIAYGISPERQEWIDDKFAYWDDYERAGSHWLFRRRDLRQWGPIEGAGTQRIGMPEAFPRFAEFWTKAPRLLPGEDPEGPL